MIVFWPIKHKIALNIVFPFIIYLIIRLPVIRSLIILPILFTLFHMLFFRITLLCAYIAPHISLFPFLFILCVFMLTAFFCAVLSIIAFTFCFFILNSSSYTHASVSSSHLTSSLRPFVSPLQFFSYSHPFIFFSYTFF